MLSTLRNAVAVLGVPFHNVTMDETIAIIEEKIAERGFHQVATANVDFVMQAIHDKELQDILCSCDLVIPDGMPIVWATRMMGAALKERVSGADLVPRLAALSAKRKYGIYLLGASEKNSHRAAEALQERFPGINIVGRYSPPVASLEMMDHEDILRRIERARPDILLVAMGNPKQEKWLAMHRDRLKVPVCIGIGGTLDFLSGAVSRAPMWMQSHGLEWLYRTCRDPQRLAQRYMNDAWGLAKHLPPQLAANKAQPRHQTHSELQTTQMENTMIFTIIGDCTGCLLADFERRIWEASDGGLHIVLNLADTAYFGPDSFGRLIQLATSMKHSRQQLWLASMKPHLLRMMRTTRLQNVLMTTTSVPDALYRIAKAEIRIQQQPRVATSRQATPDNFSIQMRPELLQNICQIMTAVSQPVQFSH